MSRRSLQAGERIVTCFTVSILNESAGRPGSPSRQVQVESAELSFMSYHRLGRAFKDMLCLCEKCGPLVSLDKYDPSRDISVTGAYTPLVFNQMEQNRRGREMS